MHGKDAFANINIRKQATIFFIDVSNLMISIRIKLMKMTTGKINPLYCYRRVCVRMSTILSLPTYQLRKTSCKNIGEILYSRRRMDSCTRFQRTGFISVHKLLCAPFHTSGWEQWHIQSVFFSVSDMDIVNR